MVGRLYQMRVGKLFCLTWGFLCLAGGSPGWGQSTSPLLVTGTANSQVQLLSTDPNPNRIWSLVSDNSFFHINAGSQNAFTIASPTFQAATQGALRIDPAGRVRLSRGNPGDAERSLHVIDSSIFSPPTLRLELNDTGSNLFRIFDLESSTTGLRVIDVTNSSAIPFTIQTNAPTNSLFVASNGSVGIGTNLPNTTGVVNSPGRYLNVRADGATAATGVSNGVFQGALGAQNHLVHLNAPVDQKVMRLQCSSGFFGFHVLNDALTAKAIADAISIKMANGNIGLRVLNPAHPLHLVSGAHCTIGGVWTNASSRDVKQDIQPISVEQARETVRALQPVGYRYKSEPDESYLGFIAEDVPELVATNDRKSLASMDITAVLTKVVQDQDRKLADQEQQLNEQRDINKSLMNRLEKLERMLAK